MQKKQRLADNQGLMNQWNWTKYVHLDPNILTCGTSKKVWWICEKGHSFLASIAHRCSINGTNCPYCSGLKVWVGFNDLFSVHPRIAAEWDYCKNEKRPEEVNINSNRKAWWVCKEGHSYDATIIQRTTKKTGCPYCSGLKTIQGINDIASINPPYMSEWDYAKNHPILPDSVCYSSNKKIWWSCSKGHSYQASPSTRKSGSSCPYCANKKVLKGYNDLGTKNLFLASEWDYDMNKMTPYEVTPYSNKRAHWICPLGHRYSSVISSRSSGCGCPICNSEKNTSFGEQAIYYYIKRIWPTAINRYKFEKQSEIDILIPEVNVGIEYDGYYFHQHRKKKDIEKGRKFESLGNALYRITEIKDTLESPIVKKRQIIYTYDKGVQLSKTISLLINLLDDAQIIDINVTKDYDEINKSCIKSIKSNSVASIYPIMATEWDYAKNYPVTPDMVARSSAKMYWWVCENGHGYRNSPNVRETGVGCPICAKSKRVQTLNSQRILLNGSLKDNNPKLATEWDYEKNYPHIPDNFTEGSHKQVWWLCPNSHSYYAYIDNRKKGRGCPICSNRKIVIGVNDLATTMPLLVLDWDHERNNDITPNNTCAGSGKKLWWKCHICSFEWEAIINRRAVQGHGCPECKGKNR